MITHLGICITFTEDCDENKGGYYCQMYTDENLDNEIGDFCIHPNEFKTFEDAVVKARQFIEEI